MFIDELILSSDSNEIIEVAREFDLKVPFKRPDHLATDLGLRQRITTRVEVLSRL